MKRLLLLFNTLFCLLLVLSACSKKQYDFENLLIEVLEGFPNDEEGYEQGVSGAYAGRLGSSIILAGGCNFPEAPVFEDGAKRFYKGIYSACISSTKDSILNWVKIGELPEEAAYGVSIQSDETIYFIGGSNKEHQLQHVLKLSFENEDLKIEKLPKLPNGIDNMSGAMLRDKLIVTSGVVDGKPSNQQITLNLLDLSIGWVREQDIPVLPRSQSISFIEGGVYYISSGFFTGDNENIPEVSGETLKLVDGFWNKCSEPEVDFTLSGSTVVNTQLGGTFAVGGVNKPIFLSAIERGYLLGNNLDDMARDSLKVESLKYLKHPPSWYNFNTTLYLFDGVGQSWKPIVENINLARAGAIAVPFDNGFYLLGGEIKPGVRTPEIVRVILN